MRFDILSNRPAAERAMREDLLKRKYRAKEEQARAAVITSETGARTGEQRFGPSGLVGEELERRYPRGLPGMEAETARISAAGYAGSARRGAATAEKGLGLERERFEFSKRYLEERGELPGGERERDDVSLIKGIAGEEGAARMGGIKCPEGFEWDGKKCVPFM
ncbi:MAG: hypothetical protein IMF19_04395 [Proteobacteria bacterium]|nr:hypothetical protein [Pseudomonadota bacterium]